MFDGCKLFTYVSVVPNALFLFLVLAGDEIKNSF
jgi:hypothetical protein